MNLEQLNAMTDEQLDEAVALAQGWFETDCFWVNPNKPESSWMYEVGDYHPTANTTEGKAQAWDLMVKYGVSPIRSPEGDFYIIGCRDVELQVCPQRAIVIASILSAQEK